MAQMSAHPSPSLSSTLVSPHSFQSFLCLSLALMHTLLGMLDDAPSSSVASWYLSVLVLATWGMSACLLRCEKVVHNPPLKLVIVLDDFLRSTCIVYCDTVLEPLKVYTNGSSTVINYTTNEHEIQPRRMHERYDKWYEKQYDMYGILAELY